MENISSILLSIRQQYQNLTGSERRIAEYILNHSEEIAGYMNWPMPPA